MIIQIYEPSHDKTNETTVRPAKTQISLGIAQSDTGLSLGGDLEEEVSLNWLTSPCFELREKF